MTRKDLERSIQSFCDRTLSEQDFLAMQEELQGNAESRKFYRESMEAEHLLEEALGVWMPMVGGLDREPSRFQRRRRRRDAMLALSAAAAILILTTLILHQVFVPSPETMIRVAFTPGSSWVGELGNGMELAPGQWLDLEFGVTELQLPNGVRAVVEGPARMRFPEPDLMEFNEGRAWIHVNPEGHGFRVRTPMMEVRDLGTEFGVITQPTSLDEVHVFSGRVEVSARQALKEGMELKAGDAARVSPVGRWVVLSSSDETAFLDHLPPTLPGIRFSFDGPNPLKPEGEHPAVPAMRAVCRGGDEPTLVDGVRGKAISIRSLGDVVVTDWQGIDGDAPRTIACWVRCRNRGGKYLGLVSWGTGGTRTAGRCQLGVAEKPGKKYPVLRYAMGRGVNFTGVTPLKPGEWYHVAAVFRGSHSMVGDMVELYVNGKRESVDAEFSQPPRHDQKISTITDSPNSKPLQIGTGPYTAESKPFIGAIDEVWILPRAVSEREIGNLMNP